jgi:diguanylate cyclase (GGDEF)-like protein
MSDHIPAGNFTIDGSSIDGSFFNPFSGYIEILCITNTTDATEGTYRMEYLRALNITFYIYAIVGIWSIIIWGLGAYAMYHLHQDATLGALREAQTSFKKDQALRQWVSSHGGVYVAVDAQTPPSKYLSHIPERDIRTSAGKPLTLMNPAYVVRQISELYTELYGVKGHITSLKLLRPENIADAWEKAALESLNQGAKEVREFTNISGKPFLRYMRPMMTKKSCLKCHGHQDYHVGDVRGGVSISIPMTDYIARETRQRLTLILSYALVWIVGLIIIWLGGKKLTRSMQENIQTNEKLQEHKHHLEKLVEKRTAEITEANRKLEYLSFTDGLTDIANRRYFDELIHQEWQLAIRNKASMAMIIVDIDYFKLFNDFYGHQGGDECLKKIAMALNAVMKRPSDFVARYGGEEFSAVLPNTDISGALAVAESMKKNIADLQIEHGKSTVSDYITVSLGVSAIVPEQNSSYEQLIKQADKALYTAKAQGRDQIQVFVKQP